MFKGQGQVDLPSLTLNEGLFPASVVVNRLFPVPKDPICGSKEIARHIVRPAAITSGRSL